MFTNRPGIYFQIEDVAESLYAVIRQEINFPKPRLKIKKKKAAPVANKP